MDLSKLPKLSQTSTPPNDDGGPTAGPAAAPDPRAAYAGRHAPDYPSPDGDGAFTWMDVFLSVGVGILFLFLGMPYGKHLMGSTTAYPPIPPFDARTQIVWSPGTPKAGQEVPYEELSEENKKAYQARQQEYDAQVLGRRMGIVSESSLFLFGVALIAAGILGAVGHVGAIPLGVRRAAMWVGLLATAGGLAYALYATVAMLANGVTPLMTMLSVLVGGMTLAVQAGAVRALAGGGRDPHAAPLPRVRPPYAGGPGGRPAPAGPAVAPARLVHHRFAHQVLRQHVLAAPAAAVGALQGPGGRLLLADLWDATCRAVGTSADAVSPAGLEAEMTQVGPYSAAVVTLPPPAGEGEAHFVGVVLRSYVRQDGAVIERQPLVLYFTLEAGRAAVAGPGSAAAASGAAGPTAGPAVLCEWQGPDHIRFADVVPVEFAAFRDAMRAKVQARQEAEDRVVAAS